MKRLILLTTLYFLVFTHLTAQNRFMGGVFAGLNLTQIDGDYQQGYQRKMFSGGIRAAMIINRNFDIGTELMYNGKGAIPSGTDKSSRTPEFYMSMHYAEAALTTNFHFDENEMGFNQKTFQLGISYGRLLKSKNEISKFSIIDVTKSNLFLQEKLNNSDVSVIVGFAYRFTPRIGFAVRHSYSVTPFFERTLPPTRQRTDQKEYIIGRSYFFSTHLFYDLWTPELRKPKKARKTAPKRTKSS
jgi:Outer membrane protein beta-barrel domain